MRKWLGLFFLLFVAMNVEAAVDPSTLIKVTGKTNSKCVEYYSYKEDLYCSTTAQNSQPVDPNIKDYEKRKIVFDERPWQAVWGQKTPDITTVEYVPNGDDIDQWHELVTSQFIPGLQAKATPKEWADMMIKNLKDSGYKPIVTFIQNTPNQVIFEFRIESPENQIQDELQMITKAKNGFYILHYAMKEKDMGQANRKKWIQNFSNSRVD